MDLQAVFYVFSGLITGNVTLVPVVVSIEQLLLSREFQTPGKLRTQIDSLIDRLQEIDVARQYFKTINLQQELSRLSRLLLYVGLPAVAVALLSLLLLTVPAEASMLAPRPDVFLPVSLTVGTLPLAVLCSYTLRMATVTNLTAATLPFTTPEQER